VIFTGFIIKSAIVAFDLTLNFVILPLKSVRMKSGYSLLILVCLWIVSGGCDSGPKVNEPLAGEVDPVLYDSTLAATLGADEYGMKQYFMAFLKAGPNRSQDSLTAANLQRAHMDNIKRLAEEGKLVLAGPFLDGGELRGIYIFNVATIEEAEALTATDPAVQAGSLVMELYPWYGSAAAMMIGEWHKKVQKTQF
jgi:uncharacterized protein YciI